MSRPFISVVIAAHNAENFIGETLATVRAQTLSDYEIVVIDDGSTDRTAEIASGCEDVILLSQSNHGEGAARNAGIRAARGLYVAFLDSDDLWSPTKLEKQAALMAAHPITVWTYTDALVFDSPTRRVICRIGERIRLQQGEILRPLFLRSFIASATPVVKKSALMEAGPFEETTDRSIGVDWSMWLRIAERHPIGLVDEPLAMIRMHSRNMSRLAEPLTAYRSKRSILTEAMERNPVAASGVRLRAHANIAFSAGLRCLRNAIRNGREGSGNENLLSRQLR